MRRSLFVSLLLVGALVFLFVPFAFAAPLQQGTPSNLPQITWQDVTLGQAVQQASFPVTAPSTLPPGVTQSFVRLGSVNGGGQVVAIVYAHNGTDDTILIESMGGFPVPSLGTSSTTTTVNGNPAQLISLPGGGTSLVWTVANTTSVLTSTSLSSQQLLTMADSMQ